MVKEPLDQSIGCLRPVGFGLGEIDADRTLAVYGAGIAASFLKNSSFVVRQ